MGSLVMQYIIYLAVATPLLIGWLFWTTADELQPPPIFHSFADMVDERAAANAKREHDRRVAEQNPSSNQSGRGNKSCERSVQIVANQPSLA